MPELLEAPLPAAELGERYRALVASPLYAKLPGKVELDRWGRILMSPASNQHGMVQIRIGQRLSSLGGRAITEASILTAEGVFVADVAWASTAFIAAHRTETPFPNAPELCIEIASPSNSRREMQQKIAAYLSAGAHEVWIVYLQSQRVEFHSATGVIERSSFTVDLAGLFD